MQAPSTKELLKNVRVIEIKTRGLVNEVFSGEYHSVFKGRGMTFSEVREYQAGDDIRSIDWNVTARFGHPFVKVFEEERELTVMLVVDLSGSQNFGTLSKTKQQTAVELSAVLAFSALKNNDKVGLLLFSDRIEKFIPPKKTKSHILRIIRELVSFQPEGKQTNIKMALEHLNRTVTKRSIVFFISDFLDSGYEKILRVIGKRHDLIAIRLYDRHEQALPDMGLIHLQDPETGAVVCVDSSSPAFRKWYAGTMDAMQRERASVLSSAGIDSLNVSTGEGFVKPLINFFKARERR